MQDMQPATRPGLHGSLASLTPEAARPGRRDSQGMTEFNGASLD
jgi:hypothetical protein